MDTTRCKTWYELNLAALRLRELYRSGGLGAILVGGLFWRLPGLLGVRMPGGMIIPGDVTVIWDVPREEVDEPDDLLDLGFHFLGAFELPEFTGENVTLLLRDRTRTTYCEVVHSRAQGTSASGVAFSTYLPGPPPQLLKTVQTWATSPLDRPEDFLCQRVAGPAEATYEAHRTWVDTFGQKPVTTTWEHFFDASRREHRTLGEHYRARQVYIKARPEFVKCLLREKGLRQG